jgi:spore germination protein YaaH
MLVECSPEVLNASIFFVLVCGILCFHNSVSSFFIQVDCKKGPDSDKAAFAAFVRELRAAFKPKGYLLTSAVSPSKVVIDAGVFYVYAALLYCSS